MATSQVCAHHHDGIPDLLVQDIECLLMDFAEKVTKLTLHASRQHCSQFDLNQFDLNLQQHPSLRHLREDQRYVVILTDKKYGTCHYGARCVH